MVFAAAGCTKTEEINVLDMYQRAYLSRIIVPTNEFPTVTESAGNAFTNQPITITTTYDFYLRTTYPAEKTVGARLCIPEDYAEIVEAYNKANGTSYGALGADYAEFLQDYATVTEGSTKSRQLYSVKFADKPAPKGEYLMPVSFTLDKGSNIGKSSTAHVMFLKRRSSATGITYNNDATMPGNVYALNNTAFTYQTEGSFSSANSFFDGNTNTSGNTSGSGNNVVTVTFNTPVDLKYLAIYSSSDNVTSVDYDFSFEYRLEGETEFTSSQKGMAVTAKNVFVYNMNDYIGKTNKKVAAVRLGHEGANVYVTEIYMFVPFENNAAN